MKKNAGTYYIIVIEDTENNKIVATGSLVLEKKFIHSCGQVRLNCSYLFSTKKICNISLHLLPKLLIYVFKLQRGRIEDIVVDSNYRGKQFGKM